MTRRVKSSPDYRPLIAAGIERIAFGVQRDSLEDQ